MSNSINLKILPKYSQISWALSHPLAFLKKHYLKEEYSIGKVCQKIAKNDEMYIGYEDYYFRVGESALKNITISLKLADKENCQSILDMASGYGRVLRYIKARFPKANITACELDKEAVDFCVETFNVAGIYGDKNIQNLKIEDKFDLIWCGSLFTHLDKKLWSPLFKFFYDHLTENGILIFTVHGKYAAKIMVNELFDYGIPGEKIPEVFSSYIKTGFGYANYADSNDYGISISSPSWIFKELSNYKGFRIVLFSEQGWDNHQDVIACVKENELVKIWC